MSIQETREGDAFAQRAWSRRARASLRWATLGLTAAVLAACGLGGEDNPRGEVESVTQTASLAKAAIDASAAPLLPLVGRTSQCDVTQHKVVYRTQDPKGNAVSASAGLAVPSGCSGPYPVLVYHHGTTVSRDFTMSSPTNGEALLQIAMYAAQGYVVVMPDYLGYGASTLGYHPYLQADNTAVVSIDALRASREVLADRGVATTGKLFLSGYSQGGHAAMATHRAIQSGYSDEFKVTAAVPQSGPYALEDTFRGGINTPGQGASVFTAMTFVGYQKSYGDVYAKPEEVFQLPYATGIETLIPGNLGFTELYTTGKLPVAVTGPGGLLTNAFVADFQTNANNPVRKHLAHDSLLDWAPAAPVTLCGGSRDPVVPFQNSTAAASYFGGRGSVVAAIDVETVPQFAPAIAAQVAAAPDLSTYHGGIVPPLCASIAKNQVFDLLK